VAVENTLCVVAEYQLMLNMYYYETAVAVDVSVAG